MTSSLAHADARGTTPDFGDETRSEARGVVAWAPGRLGGRPARPVLDPTHAARLANNRAAPRTAGPAVRGGSPR